MSMSFVVTKSSPAPALVLPSKPTPAGNLPITSTDKSRLFVSFTSFMVFERPIHEPAETIRRALSHALVYYYPIAGRMATAGAGGDVVHLACTGEGVAFASATVICTLEDVRFLYASPAITLSELSLRYGGRCGMSDPLVMIQVTEFACGGYVVATTWNHGLADASGMAQFLRAVGELARGGIPSPTVVPIRYDESFPDIPQLTPALLRRAPAGFESQHIDYAYSDVTIPWSFINRVKAEFSRSHAGCQPCTAFEAVTAAIWQCRTRAINAAADPDAPTPLVFSANVRRHIGCKDGYYGNCVSSQLVVATSGAVASGAIADVVKLIKDAKEKIPESLIRKSAGEMELDDDLVDALCGYNVLRVSCWGRIGLDAVDFGAGTPQRVVPSMERKRSPLCFPCLPCSMNEHGGANVVAFCVTEEHVQEFHAELARLR
ncbi:unnamed protein product [Urochloa humidicola]